MQHRGSGRDKMIAAASIAAMLGLSGFVADRLEVRGTYTFECHDADGNLKWTDTIQNTVVTVGKNLILDQALAGSAYTAAENMGLISSTSYSSISAADTMASHAGWLEAGNANTPTYSGVRKVTVWSAASAGSKALSSGLVFTFTGAGTVKGGFIVGGSGASTTIDNTAGTLISAGLFTGGDRAVLTSDTLTVSYSLGI